MLLVNNFVNWLPVHEPVYDIEVKITPEEYSQYPAGKIKRVIGYARYLQVPISVDPESY